MTKQNDFKKIQEVIDYKDFYSRFVDIAGAMQSGENCIVFCCFHEDQNKKSLTINIVNGVFRCLACDASGDIFHFYEKLHNVGKREALIAVGQMCSPPIVIGTSKPQRPPIPESYADECFNTLEGDQNLRKHLLDKKGINKDTRIKYRIGFDKGMARYTFPIYENKVLVNVRKYSFNPGNYPKIFSHTEPMSKAMIEKEKEKAKKKKNYKPETKWKYGEYRIYGHDEIKDRKDDPIYFCEGEWDKLLLSQYGYLAITGTAGAGSYNEKYSKLFKDRDLILVFDVDDAGEKGSLKMVNWLYDIVKSVKHVTLPYLDGSPGDNDISDLFLNERMTGKYTIEDFDAFIGSYEVYKPGGLLTKIDSSDDSDAFKIDNLSDLYLEENQNRKVEIKFMVSGNIYGGYQVPSVIKLSPKTCSKIQTCPNQQICLTGIPFTIRDREYYGACSLSDTQIEAMHKKKLCPYNQPKIRIDVVERKPIREYFITDRTIAGFNEEDEGAEIDETDEKQAVSDIRLFYDGTQAIGIHSYKAVGYVNSFPRNQELIFSASHLELISEEWEDFKIDAQTKSVLDKFKEKKLDSDLIIDDLTDHVTKIYGRQQILTLMLLTYLSPLYIEFNEKPMIGIFNSTIIGDSGTGKTAIFKTLQDFIGLGEYVRGETSGRTGIVYGIKDHKTKGWEIKVGAYIQQSERLLCVDEIQKLEKEDINTFNQGMDQGEIKIDKISSACYKAMTRLITLCNPFENRLLMEHRRPCLSLKKIFDATFIRRMDSFGFCSNADFNAYEADSDGFTLYNRPTLSDGDRLVTKEMMRALVYLMWNIKKEQIIFTQEATKKCLRYTGRLAKKYSEASDLQILPSADFRHTLARAAVGFATLNISFEDDYSKLVVRDEHVDRAFSFFDGMYSQPNCALNYYSREQKDENVLEDDEYYLFVKEYTKIVHEEAGRPGEKGMTGKVIGLFQAHDRLRKDEICDYLNIGKDDVTKKIRFLNSFNLLNSDYRGFYGRQKFHLLIYKCIAENVLNEEEMKLQTTKISDVF